MNPLRVAVLDDSAICRAQLRTFLEADGDIQVVCEGASGEGALSLLSANRAQMLIVDLQMPRMGGHETISEVMAHAPLPILVVTSQPLGPERAAVFESIRRGALDLAEKPGGRDTVAQEKLRAAVRRLATVPVVRHVSGKLGKRPQEVPQPSQLPPSPAHDGVTPLVVGIASSAGGPVALARLVGALPADIEAAVVVVQHLPQTFTAAFADFLAARTELRVIQLERRQVLMPGTIYTVSGATHIALVGEGQVAEIDGPPHAGHRPSADVLFESLAIHAGARGAGVILSGMGDDGTGGLLSLRKKGGLCLAQDKETSAVWGMPRSAYEAGAAERTLPPLGLAEVVRAWAGSVKARTE